MNSPDPGSAPSDLPVGARTGEPTSSEESPARPLHPLWGWALSAGVLAGLASGIAGERIYGYFDVVPEASSGTSQSAEFVARAALVALTVRVNEATTTFGVTGATLGLALGLAGGLAGRNVRAAVVAGCVGLILGGAAGAFAGRKLVPVFFRYDDPLSGDLILPMLVHGAIWIPIGLAAGLAFGIGLGGRGRIVRAAAGGLLGAICGTIVYELAGALAFPSAKTHYPVSALMASRLLAHFAVAVFVAAGAASVVGASRTKAAPK